MKRIATVALALALGACTHQQTTNPPSTTAATFGPAARPIPPPRLDPGADNDGRVTNAIYAGMLDDESLAPAAQEIDATTDHGNVILTGRVGTLEEKNKLELKVRSTDGVQSVDDRVEVAR
jgi:hypothetical protein